MVVMHNGGNSYAVEKIA